MQYVWSMHLIFHHIFSTKVPLPLKYFIKSWYDGGGEGSWFPIKNIFENVIWLIFYRTFRQIIFSLIKKITCNFTSEEKSNQIIFVSVDHQISEWHHIEEEVTEFQSKTIISLENIIKPKKEKFLSKWIFWVFLAVTQDFCIWHMIF